MGRRPRAFVEGLYHVGSHGSDTRDLFLDDSDRERFLSRLALLLQRFQLRLIEYALLGNHYHAVVFTPGGRISTALQQLHQWYALTHNKRNERRAHLFRAHFFARELSSDAELLVASRYVSLNPVEAGLCADPFRWPWSSCGATAGVVEPVVPLDHGPVRAAFGDTDDWRDRYRLFIESQLLAMSSQRQVD